MAVPSPLPEPPGPTGASAPAERQAGEDCALRAAEALFHAVVDGSTDGIMILTQEGTIAFANPAAAELLGRPVEGLTGQPFGIPLVPEGSAAGHGGAEVHSRTADGSVRTIELRQADARWKGQPAFLVTLRDVTALKAEVRQRDEFIAMLSHELRNPLAAILNAYQFMRRARYAPEAVARSEGVIERQFRHTLRILDDLLNVSRITQGKVELNRAPLDLGRLVAEAAESFRSQARERQLELGLQVSAENLIVEGDETRLQQVLANLLANACKYTQPGGRIDVQVGPGEPGEGPAETGDTQGLAVIRVRDTGAGICPRLLCSVFEPFVQGEQPLDRGPGGLGIGLALVRMLVGMHGGSVSAHSAGPGKGSEFVVHLPLAVAPLRSTGASRPLPPPQEGRGLRVVLVEDHEDARRVLQQLLEADGHQVIPAADGPSGLERIHEYRPDAAVIDIGLPGLDGYQLASRVRACPEGREITLIALTGYSRPEDRERALEAGFDVHLAKPLEYDRLLRVLTRLGDDTVTR
jgi:PAS domain S-box-containing protein